MPCIWRLVSGRTHIHLHLLYSHHLSCSKLSRLLYQSVWLAEAGISIPSNVHGRKAGTTIKAGHPISRPASLPHHNAGKAAQMETGCWNGIRLREYERHRHLRLLSAAGDKDKTSSFPSCLQSLQPVDVATASPASIDASKATPGGLCQLTCFVEFKFLFEGIPGLGQRHGIDATLCYAQHVHVQAREV